ncbi:MAG: helix-turn-helix domain-containing protein [Longimicrobiales bacterium]
MPSLPPRGTLHLFRPPYRRLHPVLEPDRHPGEVGVTGTALVWCMPPERDDRELQAVRRRPGGLSLLVVLPPADTVPRKDEIFRMIEFCRPAAVLPFHEEPHPDDLRILLSAPPEDLPATVVDYLRWRGVPLDMDVRRLVRRTIELSGEIRSVNALARGVYLSRRALGRRFTSHGLPVPSHWLHAARVLRAVVRIQDRKLPLSRVAFDLGYPDAFALSNQMKRLTGIRPSEARARLGWEWFLEAWLRKEALEGGFSDEIADALLPRVAPAEGRGPSTGAVIPAPESTTRVAPSRQGGTAHRT